MEQLVTYPVEQSLANLPDLHEMRSISRFGLSVVTVVFDEEVDLGHREDGGASELRASDRDPMVRRRVVAAEAGTDRVLHDQR